MLAELVARARSVRRFQQSEPVSTDTLRSLVDLARLSPCSANRQTLKFVLSSEQERNALIFPCLSWAGYLRDWPGPAEGEQPAAYILVLNDDSTGSLKEVDAGIALMSLVLGATDRGLAACILGSVDRVRLHDSLGLADPFRILYVVALGKPAETVVVEPMDRQGDIRYWRDDHDRHHVPKRGLDEIIVEP
jgi:nitroreductase